MGYNIYLSLLKKRRRIIATLGWGDRTSGDQWRLEREVDTSWIYFCSFLHSLLLLFDRCLINLGFSIFYPLVTKVFHLEEVTSIEL